MFDTLNPMSILATGISLAAMIGAVGILLINRRQDTRRGAAEDAVAKAAQDYFARFQIRARTIGAQLPDHSMVLMVETPPHKKLRFSYIIEPPIKNFIRAQTGIEVVRIFWRFPIPTKKTKTADVKYADPNTTQLDLGKPLPGEAQPTVLSSPPAEVEVDTDDYFHQHQTYHIEEVSWENFSTVTQNPVDAVEALPSSPKK